MLLALALGNLTLCAALFFFSHADGKPASLSTFIIARQCQAAAWLLLYFRGNGVLPDPVSIPAGYAVLFTGVALEAGALWEAAGHARWARLGYPLLALAVAAFLGCYFIDELGMRVVAGALILGACYLSAALALATGWQGGTMLRRFLVLATGLLALLVAARGVLVLVLPGGWGWLTNGMLQMFSSGAFYLLMLLGGFGYLLLTREQLQAQLTRLEVFDAATEVPNRRGFYDKLAPWMALARRPGPPSALVLIDFDQFKRINDSYGHPAGDAVLRQAIEVCKKLLRDSDQLGRMTGVQFALLLPRTDLPEALLVAERMRAAVAGGAIKTERAMVSLTASFGVTTIRAEDSAVSLFKRADDALAVAKQRGRNQVAQADAPVTPLS